MLWLCVHLPLMGLEIAQHTQDLAKSKPAVLVVDHKVYRMNEAAQEAGILFGSSVATATSLVPELLHYRRDCEAEREHLKKLVPIAYRFTSRVALVSPYDLMLEVSGSLKLFKGLNNIVQQLKRALTKAGHTVQIGIAHTPAVARVFAHAHSAIAFSDYPDETTIRTHSLEHLRTLSLKHSELKTTDIECMFNMGVRVFGELLDLPRGELRQRFSSEVLRYLSRLTGELPEPQQYVAPATQFISVIHLLEPLLDKPSLSKPMEQLVIEMVHWLQSKQLGVVEATWQFTATNAQAITISCRFAYPRIDPKAILEFSELSLSERKLPQEVLSLRLEATQVASLAKAGALEKDLLGAYEVRPVLPEDLLDRLTARLGPDSWELLCSNDDHRPEFAWSPVSNHSTSNKNSHHPSVEITTNNRPLWLFARPLRVQHKDFEILQGPVRIEDGWWEDRVQRDYFIGRHESGALCWLFNDEYGWFQHGYFA